LHNAAFDITSFSRKHMVIYLLQPCENTICCLHATNLTVPDASQLVCTEKLHLDFSSLRLTQCNSRIMQKKQKKVLLRWKSSMPKRRIYCCSDIISLLTFLEFGNSRKTRNRYYYTLIVYPRRYTSHQAAALEKLSMTLLFPMQCLCTSGCCPLRQCTRP
jgi:hypothetical protein